MAGEAVTILAARDRIVVRLRRAKRYVFWVRAAPAVWASMCLLPFAWSEFFGSPHEAAPFAELARNSALPIFLVGAVAISWAQPALLRLPKPWFQQEKWRFAASVVVMAGALAALCLLASNGGHWPSLGAPA